MIFSRWWLEAIMVIRIGMGNGKQLNFVHSGVYIYILYITTRRKRRTMSPTIWPYNTATPHNNPSINGRRPRITSQLIVLSIIISRSIADKLVNCCDHKEGESSPRAYTQKKKTSNTTVVDYCNNVCNNVCVWCLHIKSFFLLNDISAPSVRADSLSYRDNKFHRLVRQKKQNNRN